MANIEKRSENSYRITVSCGYDTLGKRIRKKKTITLEETMTERQKQKELNRQAVLFEKEVETGTFLDGEKITLEEFIKKWLVDYAEKQLALSTLKSYKTRLYDRVIPALGHLKLSKVQPHHLLEFYNTLGQQGARLDKFYQPTSKLLKLLNKLKCTDVGISFKTLANLKNSGTTTCAVATKLSTYFGENINSLFTQQTENNKLSSKTIKHHHDLLSSVFGTAVKWNLITQNPCARVTPPKVIKKQAKYYDKTNVAKLLTLLNNEPLQYKTAIYLAIDTGLRSGELVGLTWDDVDFENNIITINKQRQYIHGVGIITKTPKTEGSVRKITTSSTVIGLLKAYKIKQTENRLKLGSAWTETNLIFTHENGIPMHPHRPYKFFVTFLKKHNLPKISFHALRHTNTSLLISEGTDIVTVSDRLGHANKNITLNIYSHMIASKETQAAIKMDEFYEKIMQ